MNFKYSHSLINVMVEMHSVSLYEANNLIVREMSKENIISYVEETDSWIFVNNVHLNTPEILECEINGQSKIQIICVDSWTCDFQEITLHKPNGEIVNQRMSTRETCETINNLWVFVDNKMVLTGLDLQLTNGSAVEIFDHSPQQGIVIHSPNSAVEDKFKTLIADATGYSSGTYSLAEIGKKITGSAVAVDGELVTYPTITVELNEQSEFRLIPSLRSGCPKLDCGCGGVRRHDVRMITDSLIAMGKSDNDCWSAEQLSLLGINSEHHLEDNENIETRIGHLIMAGNYEKFVNFKNCHLNQ